jgi:serine protease Do
VNGFSRRCVRALPLFFFFQVSGLFAQGRIDPIRDYVGLICVADHPGIIAFVDRIREEQEAEIKKTGGENPRSDAKKEAPYERPAGSGFLFQAGDGKTYILTNRHVTAGAWSYSITFERARGEKAVYRDLVLVAADEQKDLALLAFAPGNSPEREGLLLLDRQVREGEEVFTAGFPALGREAIWQFGRGQVSNSQVMLPRDNYGEDEEFDGPFIQHTGQADPGNSGGPLLVHNPQSPGEYAVAGINARSAYRRQAANYAIPVETVKEFLAGAFGPAEAEAERAALDRRLTEFMDLLKAGSRPGGWLSYRCFVENAEYAYYTGMEDQYSYSNPVQVMQYGLYKLFDESIPGKRGAKMIRVLTVEAADLSRYEVIFQIKKKELASTWILEDGTWRIAAFGKLDGDRNRLVKAEKLYRYQWNIRDGEKENYSFFLEGGYGYILSRSPVYYGALGLGSGGFYGEAGIRAFFADQEYWQVEIFPTIYSPHLRFGVLSMGLSVRPGVGFKKLPRVTGDDSGLRLGVSLQAGLQITSSVIPGFYISGAYQFNLYFRDSADRGSTRNLFIAAAGYRFKPWFR